MSNKRLTGGGNILKGIPPTSTNFYGLAGRSHVSRAKAGMGQPSVPLPPILSASTSFSTGSSIPPSNGLFHVNGHHYSIVASGTGSGVSGGFVSAASPNSSPAYALFGGTGDQDPYSLTQRHCANESTDSVSPCVDPDYSIVSSNHWNRQGRYMKSKTLAEMGVTATNWDQLKEITITWIAGTNSNGGDRPDMHRFNEGDANKTGLPTDGADGDYHERESLYVEFFNHSDAPMGKRFYLWQPKRQLTLAELNPVSDGGHPVGTSRPLSELLPLYVYPEAGGLPASGGASSAAEFTATVITAADFNINLTLAKFFLIRQTRHTDTLDNYGVKYVNLEFV